MMSNVLHSTLRDAPLTELETANIREALRELKLFVAAIPDDAEADVIHRCASEARGRAWTLMRVIQAGWNEANSRLIAGTRSTAPEIDLAELGLE